MSPEERHLIIVGEIKKGNYPCSRDIAAELSRRMRARGITKGLHWRTVQRIVRELCLKMDAPIRYDEQRHGYTIDDPAWFYPTEHLGNDELFSSLLAHALAKPVLKGELQQALNDADTIQLATSDPADVDPDLFRSVVFATGAQPELAPDIFEAITDAWRESRRLRVSYTSPQDSTPIRRDIDIHVLFLHRGAWYARCYCHLRQQWRSLALHRMHDPVFLPQFFQRQTDAIDSLLTGNTFGYETARNIRIRCDRAKADIIRERQWFPNQEIIPLSNGELELRIPQAPEPDLLYWVLSYAGHLTILQPPSMVAAVREAARRLLANHNCAFT